MILRNRDKGQRWTGLALRLSHCALVIVIAIMTATTAAADNGWTLQRDRDGIKIWTRLEDGRAIKSYKAEMIVPASQAVVAAQIGEVENFARWNADISEARPLDRDGLSYLVYGMPFPVKDRDLVQQTLISDDSETLSITMTAMPDAMPEERGRVRIKESVLRWNLDDLPDQQATRITSFGYTDPRGVPPFILNMLIVDAPFRTMKALRDSFN